jgi:NADH dehydrogenase FAD-containing subunit
VVEDHENISVLGPPDTFRTSNVFLANSILKISNLPKISITIAGGGIGGLSLATGLQKYPQLDVHVYEGTKLY